MLSGTTSGNIARIGSISDNVDGAWTVIQAVGPAADGTNFCSVSAIAYILCSNAAARTVTFTNNSSGSGTSRLSWQLSEFSHVGIPLTLDGEATSDLGSGVVGTSFTIAGPTPSQDGDLAIAVGTNFSSSLGWTSPLSGIWTYLWITGSAGISAGIASYAINPSKGSAMSTTFTNTTASTCFYTGMVQLFSGAAVTPINWVTA